jgi:prevent-host-death family protein
MRTVPVVEFKAHISSLLAAVEHGEEIAITRHGKVVARMVAPEPLTAASAFAPFWQEAGEIDLEAPVDRPPEPLSGLD